MSRGEVEPTVIDGGTLGDKSVRETHPAFGLIGANRVSSSPGAVLFDSELVHSHTVRVTIRRAERERTLNDDWLFGREELIEIEMSKVQWASFISTMNSGEGSPCTIRRTEGELNVPGMPYAPRLAHSVAEVEGAAERMMANIREAFDAYKAHKTAANLRTLQSSIENVNSNMRYAANSLTGHVEGVVTKARADIEAMVALHAAQAGIEAPNYTTALAIGAHDASEVARIEQEADGNG